MEKGLTAVDKLLKYFHTLNQARLCADLRGERVIKVEAERVKGEILFYESMKNRQVENENSWN